MASIAAASARNGQRSRKDALPLGQGEIRRETLVVEGAAARPHRRGARRISRELLDRADEHAGVARRDHVAEAALADESAQLAVRRADEEHRPRHREDAVELA